MERPKSMNIGLSRPSSRAEFFSRDSSRLALVVAGFGYTLDMPVMYYLLKSLLRRPWNLLALDFGYGRCPEFHSLSESEQDVVFDSDIAAVKSFLLNRKESSFTLAGKSMGTTVCHLLLSDDSIVDKTDSILWLTPGSAAKHIYRNAACYSSRQLFIYGAEDPLAQKDLLSPLGTKSTIRIMGLSGADHFLETPDPIESLHSLVSISEVIEDFLGEGND